MEKYYFDNAEEFERLERCAYDGRLDISNFPAAEYRYFDRVQNIGYKVRHEGFPRELAAQDRDKALKEYREDINILAHNLNAERQYTESRIRMDKLVCEIYKQHEPFAKLKLALEFVELTIGESGFAARNMSGNYLEVNNIDRF